MRYRAAVIACVVVATMVGLAWGIPWALAADPAEEYTRRVQEIVAEYGARPPMQWGEQVPGVKTRLATSRPVIALTFDACGSEGDGYDAKLINYLKQEKIPATLFISGRWIDKHPAAFRRLTRDPLFEIENHGLMHRPCSVTGASAYGIPGTADAGEVVEEIEKNAIKIETLTGRRPLLYRSGTAYYDDVGVAIATQLGYRVVGFSVLGDAGATYPAEKVAAAIEGAAPGAIVVCHMNHPEGATAEGVIAAIPVLKKRGFSFAKVSSYELE